MNDVRALLVAVAPPLIEIVVAVSGAALLVFLAIYVWFLSVDLFRMLIRK